MLLLSVFKRSISVWIGMLTRGCNPIHHIPIDGRTGKRIRIKPKNQITDTALRKRRARYYAQQKLLRELEKAKRKKEELDQQRGILRKVISATDAALWNKIFIKSPLLEHDTNSLKKIQFMKGTTSSGAGVFAHVRFDRGKLVCYYEGEVLTAKQLNKRIVNYAKEGLFYTIKAVKWKGVYYVDATMFGDCLNYSAYRVHDVNIRTVCSCFIIGSLINHSCDPNAQYVSEGILKDKKPRIAIRALRKISIGEEITVNYVGVIETDPDRLMCPKKNRLVQCTCQKCQSSDMPNYLNFHFRK